MSLEIFSAILFTFSSGIVILFQLALAMGMPWGAASMGGKYPGVYPVNMRIVPVINSLVLFLIVLIVLVRAELVFNQLFLISKITIWFVVGFTIVSTILNTITPSKIEKIWIPVTVLQFITSLIVAL